MIFDCNTYYAVAVSSDKDIDMILIMEDNFPEFASIFWEYIKEGGYKCGWKNEQTGKT